jgi:hypothetical protein
MYRAGTFRKLIPETVHSRNLIPNGLKPEKRPKKVDFTEIGLSNLHQNPFDVTIRCHQVRCQPPSTNRTYSVKITPPDLRERYYSVTGTTQ